MITRGQKVAAVSCESVVIVVQGGFRRKMERFGDRLDA